MSLLIRATGARTGVAAQRPRPRLALLARVARQFPARVGRQGLVPPRPVARHARPWPARLPPAPRPGLPARAGPRPQSPTLSDPVRTAHAGVQSRPLRL